jgi:hypothetical protein
MVRDCLIVEAPDLTNVNPLCSKGLLRMIKTFKILGRTDNVITGGIKIHPEILSRE